MNASQRKLAMASADRLREELNRGACQTIYDEADSVFRSSQIPLDWLAQCEYMRNQLGKWRSFNSQMREKFGIPLTIVASGPAVFSSGNYQVEVIWHLNGGRAELFSLSLEGNGRHLKVPPPLA